MRTWKVLTIVRSEQVEADTYGVKDGALIFYKHHKIPGRPSWDTRSEFVRGYSLLSVIKWEEQTDAR